MGNDIKCGVCAECRSDPVMMYKKDMQAENPMPKYSFDKYGRISKIQREGSPK